MGKLTGKTALITGATSGIGLAAARLFRQEGAALILTGRNVDSLASLREELGSDVLTLQSDVGRLDQIDDLMQEIKARFGKLDVLFANAAIAKPAPVDMVSEEQFDETMNVNVKGVFFTIQKALPLLSGNSSIIVTTSIANQMGSPNFSVYSAAKAALRSLVQTLGLELIGRGIRINAISPGPIATPMFDRFGLPAEAVQGIKEDIARKSPIKRFGSPEELARVALFLASNDSSYIVGHEVVVDGGMSLL
jgi:NAD(P)-dependent dehydrogenase (short-subunit alcohol dehydrogenase family)